MRVRSGSNDERISVPLHTEPPYHSRTCITNAPPPPPPPPPSSSFLIDGPLGPLTRRPCAVIGTASARSAEIYPHPSVIRLASSPMMSSISTMRRAPRGGGDRLFVRTSSTSGSILHWLYSRRMSTRVTPQVRSRYGRASRVCERGSA